MNSSLLIPSPALSAIDVGEDDPRRDIRTGAAFAFVFFVLILGWAALAPLDAGVFAQGTISVAGNVQTVQHRDGGVVTAIHVREGSTVGAGQLLVDLAAPDLRASERALTSEYLALLAQRSRLTAERIGASGFGAPREFASLSGPDRELANEAMQLQRAQFIARRQALQAEQSVLGQRARQLAEQRQGYARQGSFTIEQQKLIADELAGLKSLEEKGFATKTRIRALERALASLKGEEAGMVAEAARASEGMGESSLQALSLHRSLLGEVARDLRDTQLRLGEVLPRLTSVREQLRRSAVRAPASGQVVGLSVFTIGGVVAPGQKLMDIVPSDRSLVIQTLVAPADADDLYEGQPAQIRFVSLADRSLPILHGKVRTVSGSSLQQEETGERFFTAEVHVPRSELAKARRSIGKGRLRPGLPVEVVIPVRKRTALQYIMEPLTGSLWRSFREN